MNGYFLRPASYPIGIWNGGFRQQLGSACSTLPAQPVEPTIATGQVNRTSRVWTQSVLSDGPCLPLRNKPPSRSQRQSPQPPTLQFGISHCTSRFSGRIISQVLHLSGQ